MFRIMFLVGLVFAILFLLLSIILFIKNDVAKLIGDVTGWNARRAIKKINARGAEEVSKTQAIKKEVSNVLVHNEDTPDSAHEKLDLKPRQSIMAAIQEAQGKSMKEVSKIEKEMIILAEPATISREEQGVADEEFTTVLGGEDGLTTVLGEEVTTLLSADDEVTTVLGGEMTTVLREGDEGTTVLRQEAEAAGIPVTVEEALPDIFEVEDEATVVHTSESIEDESAGE